METAIITGATEGIGLELSKLFAKKGINLILVARNEVKLKQIQQELSVQDLSVTIYAKDLSIPDNARFIYDDLKTKGIRVDYLVNNAGFGINGSYIDIDWKREMEMFNLNMITLAFLTKVFAKDMAERKFGKILNVGSTGSFQPGPYMAGYCATKAFVLSLSEAINHELRGSGVSVSTLCPGVTDTKFHDVAKTGNTAMTKFLLHASPVQVAEYGFKILMKRKPVGVHGFFNNMLVFSNRLFSRNMITASSGKILKSKAQVI
jgi:short-subunit dehydrogenase